MQPYIRRSGTDDSGCVLLFLFCACLCHLSSTLLTFQGSLPIWYCLQLRSATNCGWQVVCTLPISATSVLLFSILLQHCTGRLLFRFLMLDNDTEYFVEPRFAVSGGSWRDGGESSSLWRTRTSLGNSMGAEADWEIMPEDIIICKDPYGRDWQLGTGGFGSVRCCSLPLQRKH